jgi:DNA mismatch repair protein MutS
MSPAAVSMVAMVDPDRPTERTFKIARRPADGLAYAGALADKYGLSYQALTQRLAS